MPIYEYACTACGERTEAKQSFDDPPLEKCPVCGGKLRKMYSPVGIVFKGSGFYATDARKASKKASDKKASSKASTESGKASSDQKPSSDKSSGDSSKSDGAKGDSAGSDKKSSSS